MGDYLERMWAPLNSWWSKSPAMRGRARPPEELVVHEALHVASRAERGRPGPALPDGERAVAVRRVADDPHQEVLEEDAVRQAAA